MRSKIRATAAAVVASAVTLLALVACSPAESDSPSSIRIGVEFLSAPANDPLNFGNTLFLANQASYEPLVVWDQEADSYEPWLAEEFSLDDARTTMTVKLRENVDFVDGIHMDAPGVKSYFDILLATETSLPYAYLGKFGLEVAAIDEYTLEFTTTAPMTPLFFEGFTLTPIASPQAATDPDELAVAAVGTGPYVLEDEVPEVSATYVRNPDYWNPDAFAFDEVTFVLFADRIAAGNALRAGQIDATTIDLSFAADLETQGFSIHEGRGQTGTLVLLDQAGAIVPALADRRVREAMMIAFDRAQIAETLDYQLGKVSVQPFVEGMAGYVEGGDDRYPYDLERAHDLMNEAGYADGFDITIPTAPGVTSNFEPIVQTTLAEIGIRVTYEPFADSVAQMEAAESGRYPVLVSNWFYVNTTSYLYDARFPFSNAARAQELLDVYFQGTQSEAEEAVAAFGEYLLDEIWFVPFSHPPILWATTPELEMVVGDVNGFPLLTQIIEAE